MRERRQRQSRAGVGDESAVKNERSRLMELMQEQGTKYGQKFVKFDLSTLTGNKWLVCNLRECQFETLYKDEDDPKRPSKKEKDEYSFSEMAEIEKIKKRDLYGYFLKGKMGTIDSITNKVFDQWEDMILKIQPWFLEQFTECIANEGADVAILHNGEKRDFTNEQTGQKGSYYTADLLMVRQGMIKGAVKALDQVF